jgi:nitric oxide reductase NorQ protein
VSSTRVLITAARLTEAGLSLREAAEAAIICPLTDDPAVSAGLRQLLDVYLADQPRN